LDRLRGLELCLIAPAIEPGWQKAFFISGGVLCALRSLPPGPDSNLEIEAGLALCRAARERAGKALTPEQAEDMLLLDGFARRPPPELTVLPLDARRIAAHLS
jgi:hypothetical protein